MLTGHGCFRNYLYAIKKAVTEQCFHCSFNPDTIEHAIFGCPKWHNEKIEVEEIIGSCMTPDNTIAFKLEGEEKWNVIVKFWGKKGVKGDYGKD